MERNDHKNNREVLKEQILTIRDSGLTNMFCRSEVQRLAYERGFFELFYFVTAQSDQYFKFIMSGDENLLPE